MFWFAPPGRRAKLPIMITIILLERRGYATREGRVGGGQGRGRFQFVARQNEPEKQAGFNGLVIHDSKLTRFCRPPGRSP
jgi:hypothetical protein